MKRGFLEAWQGNRIVRRKKERPKRCRLGRLRKLFSRLTRLSLVGLHPCRAQLRFTRQDPVYLKLWIVAKISSRDRQLKIDKSAYRVRRFKIDKSAYRLGIMKNA